MNKILYLNRVCYAKPDTPMERREYVMEGTKRPVGCISEYIEYVCKSQGYTHLHLSDTDGTYTVDVVSGNITKS